MNDSISKRLRFGLVLVAMLGAAALPMIFGSCTPGAGITTAESDVVVTIFDQKFGFGKAKTFAVVDTIVHLTGDSTKTDDPNLSRANDALVISLVRDNMTDRGYTEVFTDSADIVILLGATAVQNYNLYSYYPWYGGGWGGWGGWCCGYPGWGWYYPPSTGVTYAYTTGTLFMLMTDPDLFDGDLNLIPIVWSGTLNGVLDDTALNKQNRITTGIDQAFKQSPYIKSNS